MITFQSCSTSLGHPVHLKPALEEAVPLSRRRGRMASVEVPPEFGYTVLIIVAALCVVRAARVATFCPLGLDLALVDHFYP